MISKQNLGIVAAMQWVKPLHAMQVSGIRTMFQVVITLLLTQLPADVPGNSSEDGLCTSAPTVYVRNPDGCVWGGTDLASGFSQVKSGLYGHVQS